MTTLHFSTEIPLTLENAFDLGTNLDNLPLIQPGYVKILKGGGKHQLGDHFALLFWQGWIPALWSGRISEFVKNSYFADVQTIGPFKRWKHTHRFVATAKGTQLVDDIEYELWGGRLGEWLDRKWLKPRLNKMFKHRQNKIREMFPIK